MTLEQYDPYAHVQYPEVVVRYLATKVTGDVYEVFKRIWNARNNGGLIKKDLAQFFSRRTYDNSVIALEAMGFIVVEDKGRSDRLYPTSRGAQLSGYFTQVKTQEER